MDNYALHAVIVKKNLTYEKAEEIAKKIINDKNKTFYRETQTSYRFRNIPKTKFKKGSFRTKKINKDISLVYGVLNESQDIRGGGFGLDVLNYIKRIKSKIKEVLSPRKEYNNTSRKTLEKYGYNKIVELNIYRTPIQQIITEALNIITFKKFDEVIKKYGYDKLFHLALVATIKTSSGLKNIIIEKNEVVNITTDYKTTHETEISKVNINSAETFRDIDLTINSILDNTLSKVGVDRFFLYDAFSTNCQQFILDILESNNILTEENKKFIYQNAKDILKDLPKKTQTATRVITDIAAVYNKLSGKGGVTNQPLDLNEEYKISD